MESKINQLLQKWPRGAVATSSWLEQQGVYRQLSRRYAASGWFQPFGHGAFVRSGETVDWLGGLYALQRQLELSVHAGAGTALSLKGLGQYLPLNGKATVLLFGEQRVKLPAWFAKHAWGAPLHYRCPTLFAKPVPTSFTEVEHDGFSVRVSAPERAILEELHLATTNAAVDEAFELMEGLGTLRPHVLQPLLESCRSVKVKRLFLWSAETAGHDWFKRLELHRVDLGKGKRSLYRAGRFDAKYQITVPPQKDSPGV